jgi:hypothetical protein
MLPIPAEHTGPKKGFPFWPAEVKFSGIMPDNLIDIYASLQGMI